MPKYFDIQYILGNISPTIIQHVSKLTFLQAVVVHNYLE